MGSLILQGCLILQEKFWNWSSWKIGKTKWVERDLSEYYDYIAVDVYNHITYHFGPYKRVYKQYRGTTYESK